MTVLSFLLRAATALIALAAAAQAAEPLRTEQLAPGVFMVKGAPEEPSPANGGRVSNLGILAGPEGAVVIGTGTSAAEGEALLAEAERLAGKPVVLAIDLHASPDHVLGNQAFAKRAIPVLAHEETDRFLVANCEHCIERLTAALGPEALAGTEASRPSRLIASGATVEAGGRTLDILYFGPAHQRGNLAVRDRASGVLFAGELAAFDRLPEVRQADLDGWLKALDAMSASGARIVVPAHGPASAPARLGETAAYLGALRAAVERAYDTGAGMMEVATPAALPEFRNWALYEPLHRRNVHFVYLLVEARDMAR